MALLSTSGLPTGHNIFLDSNIGVIEWIRAQQKGLSGHFPAFLHSHKDWKVLLLLKKTYPPLVTPATGVLGEKESC